MSLALRLDKTMVLKRQTVVRDSMGGFTNSFTADTGVPCCLYPTQSSATMQFNREDISTMFDAVTAVDVGAEPGNIAEISGLVYEVVGYLPFEAGGFSQTRLYLTRLAGRNQA